MAAARWAWAGKASGREGLWVLEARRARQQGRGQCFRPRNKRCVEQKHKPAAVSWGISVAGCAVLAKRQQTDPVPGPPLGCKTWHQAKGLWLTEEQSLGPAYLPEAFLMKGPWHVPGVSRDSGISSPQRRWMTAHLTAEAGRT